ncbi:MAG: NAD(P)/FAD-dependent oxidoreductase [Acidobacteria bacterium]|nr:NAD(P)/FAD-dependent oxidoreductase [Acidobacteriota bacterium]
MNKNKSAIRNPQSEIAVIGSGFLGLTLALRYAEQGARVTVYESAPEIGGLASAWHLNEAIVWDRHYHVTLLSDSFTRKIVEEIGLADEFEWVETKTGFYTDGKLVSMSNTLEFLRFPPLGLVSKFRLGGTIFYAARVNDWKSLEKISVEDWLTRLSGRKTFDKMWRPLLMAKLGEAYRETSAAFIWATIQRMYAARKSGLKKEMFGYVRGGYARVLERFAAHLKEKGVRFRLHSRVERIEQENGKIYVSTAQNAAHYHAEVKSEAETEFHEVDVRPVGVESYRDEFDTAILTCPSNVAAHLCPQLTAAEKRRLEDIRYQGIVCASVLMKKSLSEFYVTNITDETPFTGIIEMSALVDKREFGGRALVYLPKYVAPDDELFDRTDEEIEELFLTGLEKMYPHFRRADVEAFKISRVHRVFPLPVLNYSEKVPKVETSIDGVYILNSAQITNGTLNVNETIQLAEKFFEREFRK